MATTTAPTRKAKKKSVLKRIRQTARRTAVNRANRTRLRSQVKRFLQAVAGGNLPEAEKLLRPTLSIIDRSRRKGVLASNTAARTKSRLMKRYNRLRDQQQSAA